MSLLICNFASPRLTWNTPPRRSGVKNQERCFQSLQSRTVARVGFISRVSFQPCQSYFVHATSRLDSDSSEAVQAKKVQRSSELRAPLKSSLNAVPEGRAVLEECIPDFEPPSEKQTVGSDFSTLLKRFWKVAAPYWSSGDKVQARWRLASVLALTLGTTGISVGFNFLGRDFYNALASKDEERFWQQLLYYLGAFVGGIPVFVIRDYSREKLSLRWRAWMTKSYMDKYFENQTFYNIQSQSLIDNPDQRIVDDVNAFTSTSLVFVLALFNAIIDLISFSGILYGIYPPLFGVLVVYSIAGTALSVALGKGLVGLNFMQEKREADFRYGLVRVRENAESIAFYGGEGSEIQLLLERFKQSFANYSRLLVASRNLDFFTSAYRYLIQLLPAAVVAPLFFAGKIEFGVINQSFSAFNHVLSDFSILVYQFQSISQFSAVVDRLGEFNEILDEQQQALSLPTSSLNTPPETPESTMSGDSSPPRLRISIQDVREQATASNGAAKGEAKVPLLEIEHLTLQTPQYVSTLVADLSFTVYQGEHLLITGASGSGKTSLLRAIAGLWTAGKGNIRRYSQSESGDVSNGAARSVSDVQNYKTEDSLNGSRTSSPEIRLPPSDEIRTDGNEAEAEPNSVLNFNIGDLVNGSNASSDGVRGDGSGSGAGPRDDANVGESGDGVLDTQQIFFLPQRPYMVLGSLRQQILYPTWTEQSISVLDNSTSNDSSPFVFDIPQTPSSLSDAKPQPSDEELVDVLECVSLGHLMDGCDGLDASVEWSSVLSLGEQQRLAFARLLVSKPRLALLDESTSALDEDNENRLYQEIEKAGITYVSVGHRSTLKQFHRNMLKIINSKMDDRGSSWSFGPLAAQSPDREVTGSAI